MAQQEEILANLSEYVLDQGVAWTKEFIAYRRAWLQSKGIPVTGQLISDLKSEVLTRLAGLEGAAIARIQIAFPSYGRYIEMPRLKPPAGGTDYIAALEAWIEQKGLRQKMTANYLKRRNLRTAPPNILNQLAWSVAVSRSQNYRRRVQWWNKAKSASITELYNRVAANLPELVAREFTEAFKQ
jgi:hypothetical protein